MQLSVNALKLLTRNEPFTLVEIDIPPADIANILSRLTKNVYVTQEVASIQSDVIKPTDYVSNGDSAFYGPCNYWRGLNTAI
jgi:hypothetical protein